MTTIKKEKKLKIGLIIRLEMRTDDNLLFHLHFLECTNVRGIFFSMIAFVN